jgi:hypothetical protein
MVNVLWKASLFHLSPPATPVSFPTHAAQHHFLLIPLIFPSQFPPLEKGDF